MKSLFTPQQLRAIKNSPKGKLPPFLMGGYYSDKSVIGSVGASIGRKPAQIGGTIGIDRKSKKAFGSYNINGKVKGKFGPQE